MPRIPLRVLTLLNSQVVGRTDGRTAVVLETREVGPVAFELDQRGIDALRRNLITAERLLRQSPDIGRR